MKKIALFAALLMVFCLVFPAAAEDKTATYQLGEGDTEILVIVTVAEEKEFKINLFINTDEDTLMDALVNIGLIEVEEVSWGYNVTTVLEVEAEGDQYWRIVEHNGDSFVDLQSPIQQRKIETGDVFGLILF